jgi:type VI secretion system protein ImpC
MNALFTFDERAGEDSEDYVWGNAAYVMARHVTRAFHQWRWCARIAGLEGGGSSELLSHEFPMESSSQERVAEAAWTDRLEAVLTRQGLMALMSSKDGSRGTFFAAQSLFRVSEPNADAGILADWRRLLPCCRFIHYVKCIVRDMIGSFGDPVQLERFLQAWITNYVDGDAAQSSSASKAFKPLAAARLRVEAPVGKLDWTVRLRIMPRYQIEGIDIDRYVQHPEHAPEFTTTIPNILRDPA